MENQLGRRAFLKWLSLSGSVCCLPGCFLKHDGGDGQNTLNKPNIILVMSDDQGWGDVGFNGNPVLLTPHLDEMAEAGIRFDRFYAAAPVCSPTRGSCLTGRHPYRYGIPWANEGHIPPEEFTLAEALNAIGYRTGHFGKWHLGTLTKGVKDGYRGGPDHPEHYAPPWENGFDVCFSTESWAPTYNPLVWGGGVWSEPLDRTQFRHIMNRPVEKGESVETAGYKWHNAYWEGPGRRVTENLEGDDSRIIMDRALRFIEGEAIRNNPFLAVIWFHTPHTPIAAGHRHRAPYKDQPMEAQHWYGCLTAMDEQIGRLRRKLEQFGIAEDTCLWFCSDNGPSYIHDYNSAGPFRGKKATLFEGGIRVPAILEWPSRFKEPGVIQAPVCTSDFYPTLLSAVGITIKDQPRLDGIDLLPLLEGKEQERPYPIAFQSPVKGADWTREAEKQLALIGNRYKIYSGDGGESYCLYDLVEDPGESTDLALEKPELLEKMKDVLEAWIRSCEESEAGSDYR